MKALPSRLFLIVLFVWLLGLFLTACGSEAETTPTETPTTTIPTPTATPTEALTPTPTSTATPTPVSPLTWELLGNAAYPSEWPRDKVAQLSDGEYVEEYMPGAASKLEISLAAMHTDGDLNGDGVDDAVVIIISRPGGSGTFFDLAAVLNQDGKANPVASTFLGDRIIMRSMTIESGRIVLEMITQGSDDPMCCPNMDRREVYVLEDSKLGLIERTDTRRAEPALPRALESQRIEFAPGATSATVQGSILPIGFKQYVVRGLAGQTISLTVTSPYDYVFLSSHGLEDDAVLVSIRSEVTTWTGRLPSTQDYAINLVSVGGSETTYTLRVDIVGLPAPTPEPTAKPPPVTPTPQPPTGANKVIYLTFDDGPTDPRWTPQVAEVLSRHNAKATFFVLGYLAQNFPHLIQAEVDAGHSVGNHTYDHRTLDGIGREAFFDELLRTEKILGDKGVKCMRPPYGATDGYTLAYAAELGYKVILWNIDTNDWRRPGAPVIVSEVVEKAYPGAIVLMHDGGGDRSQTIEALDKILETLSSQGYVFEVVCP